MVFPQYKYTEEIVEIDGEKYTANIVKNHSAISSIIYQWKNKNADNETSINDYELTFLVKYKGEKDWTRIYEKDLDSRYNDYRKSGLFEILFNFETSEFKKNYRRQSRITELKSKIEKDKKELLELLKGD